MENERGFTLVELMVTIAVASILLGIGIPSFVALIDNNRLTAYANDMAGAFNLARSESIKRGVLVKVRRIGAVSSNWDAGWNVFIDVDNDGVLDADTDVVLREYPALNAGVTLRSDDIYACGVAYNAMGTRSCLDSNCDAPIPCPDMTDQAFNLCDSSAQTATAIEISVSATGRVHICHGSDTATVCPVTCPTSTP